MILIQEQITKKMPGFTSLFISFNYSQPIVDAIKTVPNIMFHQKLKVWEAPLSLLSEILDKLCLYDDIKFEWLKDEPKKKEKEIILPDFPTKPFPHQIEAIKYGLNHDKWLLLDAPGLGKTISIMYLAQVLKEKEGLEHCLVICGVNTLKTNWKNEIEKHSKLSVKILGERTRKNGKKYIGSVADRIEDLKKPIKEFFVVSNIETFRNSNIIEEINKEKANKFDMIVIDEIHTCLVYDSLIDTDNGLLKIGDIVKNKINCKVRSYNSKTNTVEYKSIKNYNEFISSSTIELSILDENNQIHIIKCTPDHKIYTLNRGYVEAQYITDLDGMLLQNTTGAVINKQVIKEPCKVYDIEVQDNHNYFAEGILVHNCKSPSSQQGKNIMKLSKAKYKIGATGTLLMNDPCDCYVPLKWIGAERSTITNFSYYYTVYGGPFHNEVIGYKNTRYLQDQLDQVSLRRTKDILEKIGSGLPPKTVIHEFVDANDAQQKFYENIKDGIIEEVDKVDLNPTCVLGMVTRLRQATACPSILTTEPIESSKILRACDLAEQICSDPANKVVIFTTFKQTANEVYHKLSKLNPLLNTGDVSDIEIAKNIKDFQEDDTHKVFIATWAKCGTGITLTRASYMIFIDCAWTEAQNGQSEDRIHRIGSKYPVSIYYLWMKNSVDERVKQIVETKSVLSSYIIDKSVPTLLVDRLRELILDLK